MPTYNAGVLDDSAPIRRWIIEIQAQDWLELAFIQCLEFLTNPEQWRESDTVSAAIAAERSTDATITFRLADMIGDVIPTASHEIPAWGLLCDGSTYNRVDYPLLYAKLATPFIVDADTFTVPNLIDRFVRGTDEFVGDYGGADSHTLTVSEMPAHSHTDSGHTHTEIAAAITAAAVAGAPVPTSTPVAAITGVGFANLQNTGGNNPHPNVPSYLYLLYYIVAR